MTFTKPAAPRADTDTRPLRILQCAACFSSWGGSEIHLINLSEELQKRGHAVTISAIPGNFVAEEAARRGIAVVPLHQRRTHDWGLMPQLRSIMREHRFDVVHVHGGREYFMPPLVAKQMGVPAVLMTRHFHKRIRPTQRFLYSNFLMDHLIAVSESVRSVLLGSGFKLDQVSTVHHCTNIDAFAPNAVTINADEVRRGWGIAPGEMRPVVGFAGRFVDDKGGDVLLRALARVPEVVGVMVGDGVRKEDWKRLAEAEGLGSDRLFWGDFRADIQNGLNAFDLFVLPSVYAEPCAAVVQQAMAMEKPVIGTRLGGTPEMIAEGETGLLVPGSDPEALAQALRTFARMTLGERQAMGRRGRGRVLEHFTLSGMAERTEALYRSIITKKARR